MYQTLIFAAVCLLASCSPALAQQSTPRSALPVALEMASRLDPTSYDFEETTERIAVSYWKRGDAANAFLQVEKLPPDKGLRLLSAFAELAAKEKRTSLVRESYTRGLKLIASNGSLEQEREVQTLARSAADTGDVEDALKFVEILDEGSLYKALAVVSIANQLARRGEKDRAIAMLELAVKQIDGFDEDEHRYLVDIAVMGSVLFQRLGERQRALELADRADGFVRAQKEPDARDAEAVALLYARLGGPRETVGIDSLQDPRSLISLALVYGERGESSAALSYLTRAREKVESRGDPDMRSLVDAYLRLDRPDDALDVVRDMSRSYDLTQCAVNLAKAFNDKGRKAEAIVALDVAFDRIRRIVSEKSADIPSSASHSQVKEKSDALLKLEQAYVDLGELGKAGECAKAIDHPQYKAMGLARVAAAYAIVDRLAARNLLATADRLSRTAEDYDHDTWRENALYAIAEASARIGDSETASGAVNSFLRELWERGWNNQDLITQLFELGSMIEREGIEVDKKSQVILARMFKRFIDDN